MRHPRPLAIAGLLLAATLLAGCQGDAPTTEITGATGIQFTERPLGAAMGTDVVWTAHLRNADNTTSAPTRLHFSITPKPLGKQPGIPTETGTDVAPIPAHSTADYTVRTPYEGPGDYSGTAEVRVGTRVVARAFVFFEQCQLQPC